MFMLANDEKNRPVPISRLNRESVCMWTLNDRPEACIFTSILFYCVVNCCLSGTLMLISII